MHLPDLVSDLAVILLTGGVITVIFKKLNLPLVLGYILAGFLIGPYMPLFFSLADIEAVSTWSEIGIIILMFCLGLEFNLHKLASVGGTAIITALVEVGGMLAMGFAVGQLMGWGTMDSIFLGGMLSMSSTTIIIKAFDELNVRKKDFAQLVFGASAPRSVFAAAAPDSTRTHDSIPAYTLPEAAAEVPEAVRTRSERRAQARAAREKARRHAEFEAMSQEERDSMFSSQVDSLIARRADSLAGRQADTVARDSV